MVFEETNGIQTNSGIKIVIYGQEGVGKTSLAAQFPSPIFIDCEGSTSKMNVRRLPKPTSWEMLRQEMEYVLQVHTEKQYQTIIIDTFDWAERLALQSICASHNVSGIEGIGYGKGWTFEAEEVGRFLDFTEQLIAAGIHVVFVCHAICRKSSVPEIAEDFDHWELKLGEKTTNKIAPLLKEWSDMTLFLAFKTNVIATDNQGKKHKATSCQRVMYTTKTAWWDAKNRFGLPDELPLAYESIAGIFRPLQQQQTAPVVQVIEQAKSAGIPTITEKDFEEAEKIMAQTPDPFTAVQETPIERQTQHILDGIAPELAQLMAANHVTTQEIQRVVGARGYFPADMPIQQYPQDFVQGCLIAAWGQVFGMIQEMRKGA